jgi:nitrogen fixation/metabolism regulation signal transduction histidine kinase
MAEIKGRGRYLALTLLLVLAVTVFWQVSLKVGIMPADSQQTILFFVLSTLVSLTFLIFAFILVRNVLKLYVERRANVLGSKFKTKLVIGALALSLLPVCMLFYFSYALTNRTLTKWFTQPFDKSSKLTNAVVDAVTSYANRETESDTLAVAMGAVGDVLRAGKLDQVSGLLEHEAKREGVDFLTVETNSGRLGYFSGAGPGLVADMDSRISLADRRAREPRALKVVTTGGVDYSVAIVPVDPGRVPYPRAWIIAANRLPAELTTPLVEIKREQATYDQLNQSYKQLRLNYLLILALVTVVLLFATTWAALFLSKQVTVPIQALAEATQQASMGNLDYRIKVRAVDELGVLVRSFNDMMTQLEESGTELERRRRETEAMLESIPTPVISLARDRRVVRVNPAVERLLGPQRAAAPTLRELLTLDELRDVDHLLRRSLRQGIATGQIDMTTPKGKVSVAVTVSALRGGSRIGSDIAYIIVMEDLSDLIHAQQSEAWQEVAQRVAHEIKNPLTPIALSAERIRRRLEQIPESERTEALQVIDDCSILIEQEVSTLKTLVDEFSLMARFPKAHLKEAAMNPIVESAIAVFDGRLDGIQVYMELSADLPEVNVDPEQVKSVIVNLVDNAAEAMEPCLFKEMRISTTRVGSPAGDFVEVAVADTGPGVSAELKEKLFLPYFSTKKRGTGLGLAIASKIITEHRGTIRVEENNPVGARFILEFPV